MSQMQIGVSKCDRIIVAIETYGQDYFELNVMFFFKEIGNHVSTNMSHPREIAFLYQRASMVVKDLMLSAMMAHSFRTD